MKKYFTLFITIVLIFAFLLVGCQKELSSTSSPDSIQTKELNNPIENTSNNKWADFIEKYINKDYDWIYEGHNENGEVHITLNKEQKEELKDILLKFNDIDNSGGEYRIDITNHFLAKNINTNEVTKIFSFYLNDKNSYVIDGNTGNISYQQYPDNLYFELKQFISQLN